MNQVTRRGLMLGAATLIDLIVYAAVAIVLLNAMMMAVFERIRHAVERSSDFRDFGFIPEHHAACIVAEPPFVRGIDQQPKRATDELPGAQQGQAQHNQGA